MNREEFGELVRALRREQRDEADHQWTQQMLADRCTGLSLGVIKNIEGGTKKKIEIDILLELADVFGLTSGERKEFFAASVPIENSMIARGHNEPEIVLETLVAQLRSVHAPAFIIDSYCDVVAANEAILDLLGLTRGDRERMHTEPGAANMLEFVFSPYYANQHERTMGDWWPKFAYQNMRIFRQVSLRYRATEEFAYILTRLRKHVEFRKLWSTIQYYEADHVVDNEYIDMTHPDFGRLSYFSTSFEALTRQGELFFCTYVPVTDTTQYVFVDLFRRSRPRAIPLAPWPNKNYP